jgi:hypothetical protein
MPETHLEGDFAGRFARGEVIGGSELPTGAIINRNNKNIVYQE